MAIAPPVKKKIGEPTPPISNVPPGPDGSPEVVAAQQALLSKTRGGPQYAKSDPRYGKTRPRTMPPMGGNQDPRSGGKPPQGPQGEATLDEMPAQIKDTGIRRKMPMPAPGGIVDGNMGLKDPRAGGLNKRTGQWTPPDPAYLEGLKNGTIEPEWKKRERMSNQPILQSGVGSGAIQQTDQSNWRGSGNPGSYGGQKPVYSNSGGGTLGSQNGDPSQGGPAEGGMPGRPGRQPLRPGMEYRPGGGQRPVGGGMQGAPQDGGQQQVQVAIDNMNPEIRAAYDNFQSSQGQMDPAQHAQWSYYGQLPQGQPGGGHLGRPDPNDPRAAYYKQLSGLQ